MPAKKLADRRGKSRYPVLEENLKAWILAQRSNGRGVSTLKIRLQASAMAKEMGFEEFGANPSWCFRFMKRHRLSVRCTTACGQKLPDNWEEFKFLKYAFHVRGIWCSGYSDKKKEKSPISHDMRAVCSEG